MPARSPRSAPLCRSACGLAATWFPVAADVSPLTHHSRNLSRLTSAATRSGRVTPFMKPVTTDAGRLLLHSRIVLEPPYVGCYLLLKPPGREWHRRLACVWHQSSPAAHTSAPARFPLT